MPDSLNEILKRNEVPGTTTNGGNNGGGNGAVTYRGTYAANVQSLLSHVSGWRTPSCLNCSDGVPPNVPVGTSCIRDTYVAAAVNYAWAAEAYYRLGKYDQAAAAAVQMNENLQYARALCGGTGVGGGDCRTFSIFPC